MEDIQKKIETYQKQISTKQKIALLIESIEILGKYSGIELPFQLQDDHGYQFDIAHNLFLTLFDELRDELIKNHFIVDLVKSSIDGLSEDLNKLDKIDPVVSKKVSDLYGNMRDSFYYLQKRIGRIGKEKDLVNLISLLLENGQFEKVVELIVSADVPKELKKEILHNIISAYPDKLEQIFATVPSIYYSSDFKVDYKEKFKELLNQNLSEILDEPECNENIIRTEMRSKYADQKHRLRVKNVVEFFVEHNLIDINDINWTYQKSEVSSAAAAYISGNVYLGKYLYSLSSAQQTDSIIRTNSDIVILEHLLKFESQYELFQFIQHKNYGSTPEKLDYIMQVILEIQPKNPDITDDIDLNRIIDILLRKTKKEDYKAMKRAIADIKANKDINLTRCAS